MSPRGRRRKPRTAKLADETTYERVIPFGEETLMEELVIKNGTLLEEMQLNVETYLEVSCNYVIDDFCTALLDILEESTVKFDIVDGFVEDLLCEVEDELYVYVKPEMRGIEKVFDGYSSGFKRVFRRATRKSRTKTSQTIMDASRIRKIKADVVEHIMIQREAQRAAEMLRVELADKNKYVTSAMTTVREQRRALRSVRYKSFIAEQRAAGQKCLSEKYALRLARVIDMRTREMKSALPEVDGVEGILWLEMSPRPVWNISSKELIDERNENEMLRAQAEQSLATLQAVLGNVNRRSFGIQRPRSGNRRAMFSEVHDKCVAMRETHKRGLDNADDFIETIKIQNEVALELSD